MSRARRAFASRANGRASCGPRTAAGDQRCARAAFRHGLSLPVLHDPGLPAEVDAAARAIAASLAGGPVDDHRHALACRIAEAMVDLRRVRAAKLPLVAAIVAMASALRVTTVAEGVETYAQGRRLHKLGCNVAQGNFYSRPIPTSSVPGVVEQFGIARRSHLKVVPDIGSA